MRTIGNATNKPAIFEEMLTAMFKTYDEQSIATETPITLTIDEENVLRYACGYLRYTCGYVTKKLRQNFLK